jgi:hypothetical protein
MGTIMVTIGVGVALGMWAAQTTPPKWLVLAAWAVVMLLFLGDITDGFTYNPLF